MNSDHETWHDQQYKFLNFSISGQVLRLVYIFVRSAKTTHFKNSSKKTEHMFLKNALFN